MKNNLLLIAAIVFSACGSTPDQSAEESTDTGAAYDLEFQNYAEREADCVGEECTEVRIVLPVLTGGDSLVRAEINERVQGQYRQLIKSRLPEPRSTGSWESLAASFIEGYELFKMEFPDDPTSWYLYMDGTESVLVADTVLTVVVDDSEFMGGAHGNTAKLVQSYSLNDGTRIDMVERYGKKLKEVAEVKFREYHSLSADETLNDAGFIFPEEGFILPENMGYSAKGISLFYNPYEVAPYSTGSTILNITLSEIKAQKKGS